MSVSGQQKVKRHSMLFLDFGLHNKFNKIKDPLSEEMEIIYLPSIEDFFYRMEGKNKRGVIYYVKDSFDEYLRTLHDTKKDCKVMVNVPSDYQDSIGECIKRGADYVLQDDRELEEWIDNFTTAITYSSFIEPAYQKFIVEKIKNNKRSEQVVEMKLDIQKALTILSKAEVRIFEKLIEGKSNRKIAEEEYLTRNTVNNHMSNIIKKLNATSNVHAVKRAIEKDLVKLYTMKG